MEVFRSKIDHTLFESALSRTDERDFIGIDHVMRAVFQDESDPRDLVTAEGSLLTGVSVTLQKDRRTEARLIIQDRAFIL